MDIDKLYDTEWSKEFETYMRNRLVLGAYRYGMLDKGKKPDYDRIREIIIRADKYRETGNQEYLVDVANFAMCEFIEPSRSVYFQAIDDDEHARSVKS